jgi:hypothetical protein
LSAERLLRIGVPPELAEVIEKHLEAVVATILRSQLAGTGTVETKALKRVISLVAAKAS